MSCFLGTCQTVASDSDSSWFWELKEKDKRALKYKCKVKMKNVSCATVWSHCPVEQFQVLILLEYAYTKPSTSLHESELNFSPPSVYFLPNSYGYTLNIYAELLCSDCGKMYFFLYALGIECVIKSISLN